MDDRALQGWARDPFGLHESRYFSAGRPTKLVRDGGVESYDEPPSGSYDPAATEVLPFTPERGATATPGGAVAQARPSGRAEHPSPVRYSGAAPPNGAAVPPPAAPPEDPGQPRRADSPGYADAQSNGDPPQTADPLQYAGPPRFTGQRYGDPPRYAGPPQYSDPPSYVGPPGYADAADRQTPGPDFAPRQRTRSRLWLYVTAALIVIIAVLAVVKLVSGSGPTTSPDQAPSSPAAFLT
jgi:hypothetical protein